METAEGRSFDPSFASLPLFPSYEYFSPVFRLQRQMSNCSSPEQGPRRIRTAHVDSYLQFLAGSLPERLNDLLPLGDIAIIPDGLIAAVLVARGAQGNHSHPAIAVLLEKEIDTDDLVRFFTGSFMLIRPDTSDPATRDVRNSHSYGHGTRSSSL